MKILRNFMRLFLSFPKETRVVLIANSFSGSNTLALFKNRPAGVEIEMVIERSFTSYSLRERIKKFREIFSSSIVVGTHGQVYYKGVGAVYIETWHGFPLKSMLLLDKGVDEKTSENLRRLRDKADYYLSLSQFYTTILNSTLGLHWSKYILTGYPRNDFLFKCRQNILKKFGMEGYEKIVFYLPTFRKPKRVWRGMTESGKIFSQIVNLASFDEKEFESFLRINGILWVIKPHIASADFSGEVNMGNVVVLKDEKLIEETVDLYELLACADVLVTDYSSVYFDFLLTGKPMVFLPTDIDLYREKRGFLLEPYEMWTPGPKVYTQEELQDEILKSLSDPSYYEEERERLKNIVHRYQDAKSSERVWKFILDLLEKR